MTKTQPDKDKEPIPSETLEAFLARHGFAGDLTVFDCQVFDEARNTLKVRKEK